MKIFILAVLSVLMVAGTGGCAAHYYHVSDNRVHIYLYKPEAREILFASSLDQYQLHRAEEVDTGLWKVTLPTGSEFKYFYIVDGAVFVPSCRYREKDDFGSEICIFIPSM